MNVSSEAQEVSQDAPSAVKPRLSVVVVLAMLLGALLTVLLVVAYYNLQRNNAMQAEIRATRAALSEKSLALDEMKAQIEALSKQMNLLKDYSVARSSPQSPNKTETSTSVPGANQLPKGELAPKPEQSSKAEPPPKAGQPPKPEQLSKAAAHKESNGGTTPPVLEKGPPTSREPLNCDLAGKSAEEQVATLKRCVEVMDSVAPE